VDNAKATTFTPAQSERFDDQVDSASQALGFIDWIEKNRASVGDLIGTF
jgi:hypothetical protein